MKYAPGQSGNPKGKPKGANKTQKIRDQLMSAVPAILQAQIDQALTGDPIAARLILERTLPALRPESRAAPAPVPVSADAILAAVAHGAMTPDQGGDLMNLLLAQAKLRESTEVVERLVEIEKALAELKR